MQVRIDTYICTNKGYAPEKQNLHGWNVWLEYIYLNLWSYAKFAML